MSFTAPVYFTINFTLTNLSFSGELANKSNPVASTITSLVSNMLENSSLSPEFNSCQPFSFSPGLNNGTTVVLSCTFKNDTSVTNLNRVTVYTELSQRTQNSTLLGPYGMDPNSFYVNGYHEIIPYSNNPILPSYSVNFTITNVKIPADLGISRADEYQYLSLTLTTLMDKLFRNSSVPYFYSSCTLLDFSPANGGDNTAVYALCNSTNNNPVDGSNVAQVYHAIRSGTANITTLGPYTLDQNSLYVNNYTEGQKLPFPTPTVLSSTSMNPMTESTSSDSSKFTVNFTIINRNYSQDLDNPNSLLYKEMKSNITQMMTALYSKSSLNNSYQYCTLNGFSAGSVKVNCLCTFKKISNGSALVDSAVQNAFATGTNSTTLLGGVYELRSDSLSVKDTVIIIPQRNEVPFWAIILIVLAILLGLILLFFFCFLLALLAQRRMAGSYDLMKIPYGEYYTHLK
ncbi:mucin-16-like [Erpetoichthys calabaricus]|uniref:mucin-16-like n=1 Tax=Erpetoichthys calabaricus TaxID=27687 RepID=UPI0022343AF5|nr:mucin-16-like [Erpetoichthys calabaricus]